MASFRLSDEPILAEAVRDLLPSTPSFQPPPPLQHQPPPLQHQPPPPLQHQPAPLQHQPPPSQQQQPLSGVGVPVEVDTVYRIVVRTGERPINASDPKLYVTLQGSKRTGATHMLQSSMAVCRALDTITMAHSFTIHEPLPLGSLSRLRVGHATLRGVGGWFLKSIDVSRDDDPSDKSIFPCNQWLSPDGSIWEDLVASQALATGSLPHSAINTSSPRMTFPSPHQPVQLSLPPHIPPPQLPLHQLPASASVPMGDRPAGQSSSGRKSYRVTVETDPVKSGGAGGSEDAPLDLTIFGSQGNSGRHTLLRGTTPSQESSYSYTIEEKNLGDILNLCVQTAPTTTTSTTGSKLFLTCVRVRDPSTGEAWSFPCNSALPPNGALHTGSLQAAAVVPNVVAAAPTPPQQRTVPAPAPASFPPPSSTSPASTSPTSGRAGPRPNIVLNTDAQPPSPIGSSSPSSRRRSLSAADAYLLTSVPSLPLANVHGCMSPRRAREKQQQQQSPSSPSANSSPTSPTAMAALVGIASPAQHSYTFVVEATSAQQAPPLSLFVLLTGEKSEQSEWQHLCSDTRMPSTDTKAKLQTFSVSQAALGELQTLKIGQDEGSDGNGSPDWFVKSVRVREEETGTSWLFVFNEWVDSRGNIKQPRTPLHTPAVCVVDGESKHASESIEYRVKICTEPSAVLDGTFTLDLTLVGAIAPGEPHRLSGTTAVALPVFVLRDAGLGDIKKVIIKHHPPISLHSFSVEVSTGDDDSNPLKLSTVTWIDTTTQELTPPERVKSVQPTIQFVMDEEDDEAISSPQQVRQRTYRVNVAVDPHTLPSSPSPSFRLLIATPQGDLPVVPLDAVVADGEAQDGLWSYGYNIRIDPPTKFVSVSLPGGNSPSGVAGDVLPHGNAAMAGVFVAWVTLRDNDTGKKALFKIERSMDPTGGLGTERFPFFDPWASIRNAAFALNQRSSVAAVTGYMMKLGRAKAAASSPSSPPTASAAAAVVAVTPPQEDDAGKNASSTTPRSPRDPVVGSAAAAPSTTTTGTPQSAAAESTINAAAAAAAAAAADSPHTTTTTTGSSTTGAAAHPNCPPSDKNSGAGGGTPREMAARNSTSAGTPRTAAAAAAVDDAAGTPAQPPTTTTTTTADNNNSSSSSRAATTPRATSDRTPLADPANNNTTAAAANSAGTPRGTSGTAQTNANTAGTPRGTGGTAQTNAGTPRRDAGALNAAVAILAESSSPRVASPAQPPLPTAATEDGSTGPAVDASQPPTTPAAPTNARSDVKLRSTTPVPPSSVRTTTPRKAEASPRVSASSGSVSARGEKAIAAAITTTTSTSPSTAAAAAAAAATATAAITTTASTGRGTPRSVGATPRSGRAGGSARSTPREPRDSKAAELEKAGMPAVSGPGSAAAGVEAEGADVVAALPKVIYGLDAQEPTEQLRCARQLRRMLTAVDPPMEQIVVAGAIPSLMGCLNRDGDVDLHEQALGALANISYHGEQVGSLVDEGVIPVLITLLATSASQIVRTQAMWALGNIAAESTEMRDAVLEARPDRLPVDVAESACAVVRLINTCLSESVGQVEEQGQSVVQMCRNATWTLSNLSRGKPEPDFQLLSEAMPALCLAFDVQDEDVLKNACWTTSHLTDSDDEQIQAVIDSGCASRVLSLFSHHSKLVQLPALRTLGNIVSGTEEHTQYIMTLHKTAPNMPNILTLVQPILDGEDGELCKEACWMLSNVMTCSVEIIQEIIDAKLLDSLMTLLESPLPEVQKEAWWAVCNATTCASVSQLEVIVARGFVRAVLAQFGVYPALYTSEGAKETADDDDGGGGEENALLSVALEGLNNLIEVAFSSGSRDFITQSELFSPVDGLAQLRAFASTAEPGSSLAEICSSIVALFDDDGGGGDE